MDRRDIILRHVNLQGHGLEIGPSYHPIAPKKEGFRVDTIDHLTREQLIQKYRNEGVNLDNIEEVDYIWKGGSYTELIGKENHYDWIIASHVIEHTPDLVGFLNECDKLLKEDGVISLVIPDKRYCFDRYRPLSGLAGLIDNHLQKSTYHSPGMAADYFLNVVFRNQQTSWHKDSVGEDKFVHTVEHALKEMASIQKDHTYLDLHAWCFVPHSFRLLMEDLFELKMIHLREVDFHPTQGCEFYVTLGRKGPGPGLSRMDLLTRTDDEIREGLADGSKPSEVPVTKITPPLDQTLAHSPQPSFLSAWLRSFRKARRSS